MPHFIVKTKKGGKMGVAKTTHNTRTTARLKRKK